MAVSVDDLAEIEKALTAPGAGGEAIAELRRRFQQLSWTRCDAADVTDAPFRTFAQFDLHLLDRTNHCPQITVDPARATGIILALRSATP